MPTGLPLPSISFGSGAHEVSMTAVVHATQDPEITVRTIGPSSVNALNLDGYLALVAEAFEASDDSFRSAFYEANGDWLSDPIDIADGIRPGELHIEHGETARIVIRLVPTGQAGLTMLALPVARSGSDEILGISELVGLTVTEEGFIFRDF